MNGIVEGEVGIDMKGGIGVDGLLNLFFLLLLLLLLLLLFFFGRDWGGVIHCLRRSFSCVVSCSRKITRWDCQLWTSRVNRAAI